MFGSAYNQCGTNGRGAYFQKSAILLNTTEDASAPEIALWVRFG